MKSKKEYIREKIIKINGEEGVRTYKKVRKLGRGGYAKVYELSCLETGKRCAAKFIPKTSLSKPHAQVKLMKELKIHRSLHHENIVSFEHYFEDSHYIYMLLELCENQSLCEMIRKRKRITEVEIKSLLYQLILGLVYLHSNSIIHRDIKLGNVLLNDKMQVKIGDFGLACKLEFTGERRHSKCGTPNYIAPEILDGHSGHEYKVDVWSVGVLAYIMFFGRPPFDDESHEATYRRIRHLNYKFPRNPAISPELKDFISSVLVLEARPSAGDLLLHPFFVDPFPRFLPTSFVSTPPTPSFLNSYKSERKVKPLAKPLNIIKENEQPWKENLRSPIRSPLSFSNKKMTMTSLYVPSEMDHSCVWVKKWIDCSHKYGLGYVLSNGNVGIYFKDSTKMISQGAKFFYFHRVGPQKLEEIREYSFEDFPDKLTKKVNLLEYFITHLGCGTEDSHRVYIKKWMTTPHASIFRLSDKTIQVYFNDETELVIGKEKNVSFVDKQGTTSHCSLTEATEEQNPKVHKRLNYIKEALASILGPMHHDNN